MLPLGRFLKRFWLLHFSQSAGDRALYKAVDAKAVRSIVEIGLADLPRTLRLWDLLAQRDGNLPLRYTGIDPFESRLSSQGPALSLKQTFAALRRDGVQVKLVPGDPQSALHRTANSLTGTDLLIISRSVDAEALAPAWRWMPRMLHAGTIIFQETTSAAGGSVWQRLSIVEVQQRAALAKSGRKAA